MANTYTQLNIQAVFVVSRRENLLSDQLRPELFKYIAGILRNRNQFPLAVNGYKDHIHIFFELHPTSSVSEILQIVKSNSSKWINENSFIKGKFNWQVGYGAFTYSHSQRNNVIQYIMNQEKHHMKKSFKVEYLALLKKFEIDFNKTFVFDFFDA